MPPPPRRSGGRAPRPGRRWARRSPRTGEARRTIGGAYNHVFMNPQAGNRPGTRLAASRPSVYPTSQPASAVPGRRMPVPFAYFVAPDQVELVDVLVALGG